MKGRGIFLWIFFTLAATLISLNAGAQTYKTTEPVNLRQKPDSKSEIIRTLDQDERVEKIGSSRGFLEVRTKKGEHGFVWNDYLKIVADSEKRVPAYHEFLAALERRPKVETRSAPGLYYFETVLEYLRIENHPVYAIALPLLVAVGIGIGGLFLGRICYPDVKRIIPAELGRARKQVVKWLFLIVFLYVVAKAVLYFVDLSLHYASLEKDSVLVLILVCPRIVLAGPVAAIDILTGNWVLSVLVVMAIALILIPGMRALVRSKTVEEEAVTRIEEPPVSSQRF
jgi:hypothetical protein